jgi:hypothetical protein
MANKRGFGRKRSWPNRAISQYLPGRTENNHENSKSAYPVPSQYSNRAQPRYKSRMLLTDPPVRYACISVYMDVRESAIGIVTGYLLDDRAVGVRVPVGA